MIPKMTKIVEFKEAHLRFSKALRYITENEAELKKDPKRWQKIKHNFEQKFEKPLDEVWNALSKAEKKSLASLYLFRKAQEDEVVQKVIKTFKAKIVRIRQEEGKDEK